MKHLSVKNEYERCVLCKSTTNVLKSTHIDFRECYEIGCGQLCIGCYQKIHSEDVPKAPFPKIDFLSKK